MEQVVAQICREAGARVRTNVLLRDLNLSTPASDDRRIEVVASGVAVLGGAQLAVGVTVRSPLTFGGWAKSRAHWHEGATAEAARADKESKYPEFMQGNRCRLVVLAVETGGRFSSETLEFLQQLAHSRSQSAPAYLRRSTALAYERRWSRMLSCTIASSLAASLLLDKDTLANESSQGAREPWLQDIIAEARNALMDELAWWLAVCAAFSECAVYV